MFEYCLSAYLFSQKILLFSYDPLKIINGKHDRTVESAEFKGTARDIVEYLDLNGLFIILRRDLMLCAASVIALIIMKWMLTTNPFKIASQKEELLHKLSLVFAAASLLTFLNLLYSFFSNIF